MSHRHGMASRSGTQPDVGEDAPHALMHKPGATSGIATPQWRLRGVQGHNTFEEGGEGARLAAVRAGSTKPTAARSTRRTHTTSSKRGTRAGAPSSTRGTGVPRRRRRRRQSSAARAAAVGVKSGATQHWRAALSDASMAELKVLADGPLLRVENIGTSLHRSLVSHIFDVRAACAWLMVLWCDAPARALPRCIPDDPHLCCHCAETSGATGTGAPHYVA